MFFMIKLPMKIRRCCISIPATIPEPPCAPSQVPAFSFICVKSHMGRAREETCRKCGDVVLARPTTTIQFQVSVQRMYQCPLPRTWSQQTFGFLSINTTCRYPQTFTSSPNPAHKVDASCGDKTHPGRTT
ncbi:hypothetical protein PISMIDRAFT_497701 [Pisolithus microcarpus 441]|uniref:Uncharacterized protein n=1 Tax=Pisolithus microcarpus 441 TaxID=765257 RepID=A0A0C9YCN5_9AGAM|nr:hypothetical protein PISMIDRAFT_497701 [Pisolithus microcarpus 441]